MEDIRQMGRNEMEETAAQNARETVNHVSFKAAMGDRKESFRNPQNNGISSQADGSPSSTTAKQGNGHQKLSALHVAK